MTHQEIEIKVKNLEKRVKALEQEPCGDTISRQAAIDAIEKEQNKIMHSDWAIDKAKFYAMSEIRALIAELPPVTVQGLEGRMKTIKKKKITGKDLNLFVANLEQKILEDLTVHYPDDETDEMICISCKDLISFVDDVFHDFLKEEAE